MRSVAARRGSDHDPVGPGAADRDHHCALPDPPAAVVAVAGLVTGPDREAGRPDHPQGLPQALRQGVENLSGLAMGDVRVHRNSPRPAALGALAYTEGTEIHLGPGQDRHLPHEAWHVVQQKQGRVRGRRQAAAALPINQDATLEREADRMGARAARGDPGGSAPDPVVAAPATRAIQLMKVGVEITFSNDDLLPMSLTKKAYLDVCARLGNTNPPSFDDYTESIGKEYFKPWTRFVRKPVENVPAPAVIEPGDSPKGFPLGLNTVFTYDLKKATSVPSGTVEPDTAASAVSKEPVQPPDGPVVSVVPANVLKQEVGEPTPSTSEAKPGEKTASDALPDRWWWDIDIDPACLEIRAMPIEHTLYAHPIVRGIIDAHIYGGAKKLGLRTGYGGEGGGHISVDLATGFGGDPLNVVKTMAWVELNKNEIDRDVELIDVIDNKNAPYLFHPGRDANGLQALRTWLVQSLVDPKLRGQDRPAPAPAPAPQPAPGQPPPKGKRKEKKEKKPSASERAARAEQARLTDLGGVPWNDHLVELGRILATYLASSPAKDDASQQPGMFAELDAFEKLHYLAVNLQHTRTADRAPHDESDKALAEPARRVEFRRLVSQRNVVELIAMINQVVRWIETATQQVPEVLAKELETAKSELLVQSAELMASNRSLARKVEKRDRHGS